MVLSKNQLIAVLQNEARILVHLCSKIEPNMVDYRPTPKQRSTIELLRYLTVMGPQLIPAIRTGTFDGEAWGKATAEAANLDLAGAVAKLETLSATYAELLSAFSDDDFQGEIGLFGPAVMPRGMWLVNLLTSGHAAYRTQLFLYLKACGREELNTFNLWQGVDGSM